jgi:hypothetical protein
MPEYFIWSRPDLQYYEVDFEWKILVPFLHTTTGESHPPLETFYQCPPQTPKCSWKFALFDEGSHVSFRPQHFDVEERAPNRRFATDERIYDPLFMELTIRNSDGEKTLKQSAVIKRHLEAVFRLSKEEILRSGCELENDNLLEFCLKVHCHVEKTSPPKADTSDTLATEYEEMFYHSPHSLPRTDKFDIYVRGRKFEVFKNILEARSPVFARLFQGAFQENRDNAINIEDIKPDVFDEFLHFIYAGRLTSDTLVTMAAELFIAADQFKWCGSKILDLE